MTPRPPGAANVGSGATALTLRIAREEDTGAVRALLAAAWRRTYATILDPAQLDALVAAALHPDALRARVRAPDAVALVAGSDGAIVGHLAARLTPRGAHVDRLYVAAAAQGRGVGARLLAALQERLGPAGVVTLHVEASNERARAFYLRQGFRETGRARESIAGVAFDVRVLERPGVVQGDPEHCAQ